MGGELTFQTDPGVGTTVSLRWQPEAVGEPERTVVPAGERKRAGGRLLVVEDEPVYAMLLERVLCDEGFDVQLADSLSSVGELMDGGHIFDGVLTDQNLPDADARQVIERVSRRASWGSPPCAVAVMSADIEEASVAALRAEGVQVFLSKTADVRWLVSQLLHHPAWAQVKAVDDAEPVSARLLSDHDSAGLGRL
jgi:CheY-like chemotaxis protein